MVVNVSAGINSTNTSTATATNHSITALSGMNPLSYLIVGIIVIVLIAFLYFKFFKDKLPAKKKPIKRVDTLKEAEKLLGKDMVFNRLNKDFYNGLDDKRDFLYLVIGKGKYRIYGMLKDAYDIGKYLEIKKRAVQDLNRQGTDNDNRAEISNKILLENIENIPDSNSKVAEFFIFQVKKALPIRLLEALNPLKTIIINSEDVARFYNQFNYLNSPNLKNVLGTNIWLDAKQLDTKNNFILDILIYRRQFYEELSLMDVINQERVSAENQDTAEKIRINKEQTANAISEIEAMNKIRRGGV